MAKTKEKAKPTRKSKAKADDAAPAKAEGPKYGVPEICEATGLQPASVRVGLRESDFTKEGKTWGWNTKKDFDAVLKFFKDRAAKQPVAKDDKEKASGSKPKRKSKKSDD